MLLTKVLIGIFMELDKWNLKLILKDLGITKTLVKKKIRRGHLP